MAGSDPSKARRKLMSKWSAPAIAFEAGSLTVTDSLDD
jgi:hypothetical protein